MSVREGGREGGREEVLCNNLGVEIIESRGTDMQTRTNEKDKETQPEDSENVDEFFLVLALHRELGELQWGGGEKRRSSSSNALAELHSLKKVVTTGRPGVAHAAMHVRPRQHAGSFLSHEQKEGVDQLRCTEPGCRGGLQICPSFPTHDLSSVALPHTKQKYHIGGHLTRHTTILKCV